MCVSIQCTEWFNSKDSLPQFHHLQHENTNPGLEALDESWMRCVWQPPGRGLQPFLVSIFQEERIYQRWYYSPYYGSWYTFFLLLVCVRLHTCVCTCMYDVWVQACTCNTAPWRSEDILGVSSLLLWAVNGTQVVRIMQQGPGLSLCPLWEFRKKIIGQETLCMKRCVRSVPLRVCRTLVGRNGGRDMMCMHGPSCKNLIFFVTLSFLLH